MPKTMNRRPRVRFASREALQAAIADKLSHKAPAKRWKVVAHKGNGMSTVMFRDTRDQARALKKELTATGVTASIIDLKA